LPAVGVELGAEAFHAVEVQVSQPVTVGEIPQQLGYHARVTE